ncbi:ABC transporter ATP-binding protein [Fervidicoccus fontis]|uniref:ABC transporter ATP-binding protein n=2 Tax=Fervidicoccus fontis TaxID=683846 RepID=A0A843AF94_9CREN|nr:ABC transporter ATP-binding protein [Fervidicoccus fontis]
MMSVVLEVNDLETHYYTSRGTVKAVHDVSFKLNKEEVLGIAGESGCGKSTLGWSIMGMPPPPGRVVKGSVKVDGIDVLKLSDAERRRTVLWKKISMVFQGAINAFNPVYTIGDQLAEPLIIHENYTKKEAIEKVKEYLKMVGLNPDVVKRYPHELSGGMKQRAVIAMALILEPTVFIADEPTTALDVVVQAQILNLMKELKKEKKLSFILITHDMSVIAELADKVAIMYAGEIVELGTSEQIFLNPMHPYTQALLRSIPRLKGDIKKLEYIPGEPPNLIFPLKGCPFNPRCTKAVDICTKERPHFVEVEKDHYVKCWLYEK